MARFIALLLLCGFPSAAHAGAWTQPKGAAQLITTASSYSASHFYTVQGDRRSQATYRKQELATYGEYGLTDIVTVGGQLFLTRADQLNFTAADLGDSEFFVRTRLWQDNDSVVSLQPYMVLPSPDDKNTRPKIGSDHPFVGLRGSYGRNFTLLGKSHYTDLSVAYLYRAGNANDQLKIDATVGLNLTEQWQIVPQAFITKSAKKVKAGGFTNSSADDYDAYKLSLSVQYTINDRNAVSLGYFGEVAGRNTGSGKGFALSYGRRF